MVDYETVIKNRIEHNKNQSDLDVIRMRSVCEAFLNNECDPWYLYNEIGKYFKVYDVYMGRVKELEKIMSIEMNM